MRTKIKVDGKFYRPVPWLEESDCVGCAFEKSQGCPHNDSDCCNWDDEFSGQILIPMGKEAMAEYIARRLAPKQDEEET